MINPKMIALGTACFFWLLLTGCSTATSTPQVASTLPHPSDTAQPTFVPTWTPTAIPPTLTRFPTRTQVTSAPATTMTSVMTYTATVSNLPTDTPTPTLNPNLPTPTQTPTPVQSTRVPTRTRTITMTATQFDAGVSISQTLQDKSIVPAGKSFQVTFTLKNTGTSTWTGGYGLKWFSGLPGYGIYPTNNVPVPQDVHPGESVDLTITCLAPNSPGSYFSMWYMQNPSSGSNFIKAYIEVEVK